MKLLIYLFLALSLTNCKTRKDLAQNQQNKVLSFILENCPEDGICEIVIEENKELQVKTDEFGMFYPEITNGDHYLFNYTFSKDSEYADGNYKEIVLFQFPKNEISLLLQNKNLQKVNLLYGRLCYCKGESGYEKVSKGTLNIKRDNNKITLKLEFYTNLPQVIKTIEEVIILP